MFIKSLAVKNFRNLKPQKVVLKNGLNVFCGKNAQGKTNFLEGVLLCALGKSPRADKDKDLINWQCDWAVVKTEFQDRSGDGKIEIKLTKGEKKRVAVNTLPVLRIGELLGNINVIYFSPDEIAVIKQGPDARRRFIDVDLCQTDKNYFYSLGKYNKILAQRNNLLKTQKNNADVSEMLSIWDRQLASEGARIYMKRRAFLQKISPIAQKEHLFLTDGKEDLQLIYQSEVTGETLEEARQNILNALSQTLEKQLRLGFTCFGVHRDDVKFSVSGADIRKFGSQGQQRTAALALKLAEVDLLQQTAKDAPVLLLDDVFSEIDAQRKARLLEKTAEMQTLVTATEFQGEAAAIFSVEDGVITPKN